MISCRTFRTNGAYGMISGLILFILGWLMAFLVRSSMAKDVDKSIYGSTVPVLKGEKLSMRILVIFFLK